MYLAPYLRKTKQGKAEAVALVAFTLLPVVQRFFPSAAPKSGIDLVGTSGSGKSETASLLSSLYRHYSRDTPPAQWGDTVNTVEVLGYALADALFWVDDRPATVTLSLIHAAEESPLAHVLRLLVPETGRKNLVGVQDQPQNCCDALRQRCLRWHTNAIRLLLVCASRRNQWNSHGKRRPFSDFALRDNGARVRFYRSLDDH